MPQITYEQAACCLTAAAETSAADAGAPPFTHRYLSVASTWPYCPHDSILATWNGRTTVGPPGPFAEHDDARDPARVWFDLFELYVIRCGPPFPEPAGECNAALYGDCADPLPGTLTYHHNLVTAEADRLAREVLDLWCDCLAALPDVLYSRSWPRWIVEGPTIRNEGRFTAIVLSVAAQIR